MSTFIVAGLGNPGPTYQWTRHNAGFLFLDRLAHLENFAISKKSFSGLCGEWNYVGNRLILLKPQTFMNLSGNSVMQALQFYKLPTSHLIVIHDELDLPFGTVRFKNGGGHGGHNGLRSIMEQLGNGNFIRLRIGIGKSPHKDTTGHVLGTIPPDQMEVLPRVLDGGRDMLEVMLKEGISKSMTLFNNKNFWKDRIMGFNCGIVGLPNVGKSTIFNALTSAGAESANYPFCTIEPNVGIVQVPDPRMEQLSAIVKPQKIQPTTIEFVDIAGLVKGASQGEGLGNQFLGHIRSVDAIVHVVRCFDDDNVVHVNGRVSPADDIETINTELALADLDTIEKKLLRAEKMARSGDKKAKEEVDFYLRVRALLEQVKKLQGVAQNEDEKIWMRDLHLLTDKPVLYVANVAEDDLEGGHPNVATVRDIAASEHAGVVVICGKLEAEIAELDGSEKQAFLDDMGLEEAGLDRLIRNGYALLGLITYFTAGVKEVRAWTIVNGTKAPQAAGVIHTDFEKGFIRAEVIAFQDYIDCNGESGAKEKGLMRLEGKEYIVKDGDVMHFRFNV